MFSTSTPDTRVLWAAHSYNVAFSDEIGHFEYCNAVTRGRCDATTGAPNATDQTHDGDDVGCATAPVVTKPASSATLTGCLGTDTDFDGPEYQNGTWPGSPGAVASKVSTPIQFTSLLFRRSHGDGARGDDFDALRNYDQVAFETDLPRIEGADTSPNNTCQRHVSNPADPSPGMGCVNPPNGELLPDLHHDESRRNMRLARGSSVHPRNQGCVWWHLGCRVRRAAGVALSCGWIHHHPALQQLPQEFEG